MIFTSIAFLLFFLVVVIFYYLLPGRFRWIWLLVSSIFFYMYTNPFYIIVPIFITLITFISGIQIEKASNEKTAKQIYLWAIFINVGVLIFFKYINFFTSTTFSIINFTEQTFFGSTKTVKNSLLLNIAAPLGISYFIFQAIGYLIEIKRGNHPAEKNIGYLSTFLLFFPKTIAGPVERANHFLPQLKQAREFNYENISDGVKQVIWGLFKKLVIADRISIYVDAVLNNPEHQAGISLIVASVLYVFQMYADFSGYTDMALGFAKILGFDIIQNFRRPLLAKSVTEFWRKWHISLSTWFADYFYTPIAIAKRDWGKWGIVYAFFTTFIVLGFWHGANWTFIVFGGLQGLLLTLEFFTRKFRKAMRKKIPVFLIDAMGVAFTFSYFAFSLIFFRADSLKNAFIIISRMFSKGPLYTENFSIILFSFLGVLFLILVEIKEEYYNHLFSLSHNNNWLIRNCYYCFLLIAILLAGVFDGGEFIYFQF
jgi:alginate O-acetyltransferase complex protein AlgI